MKTIETAQSMAEFFNRPDVKAQQEIQKRNPYGSEAHRKAFAEIKRMADEIGAGEFVGNYED
jgi:hypothetical protein